MFFYASSNRLSRLCLLEFKVVKQSRVRLHLNIGLLQAGKKFSVKRKSGCSSRWLRRQSKVGSFELLEAI